MAAHDESVGRAMTCRNGVLATFGGTAPACRSEECCGLSADRLPPEAKSDPLSSSILRASVGMPWSQPHRSPRHHRSWDALDLLETLPLRATQLAARASGCMGAFCCDA